MMLNNKVLKQIFENCHFTQAGKELTLSNYAEDAKNIYSRALEIFKYCTPFGITGRFLFNQNSCPILYHYLPWRNLKMIIQSGQFYIGHQDQMNDPWDRKYIYRIAEELLIEKGVSLVALNTFRKLSQRPIFDRYVWSFTANNHSFAMQNYGDTAIGMDVFDMIHYLTNKNDEFYIIKKIKEAPKLPVFPIKVCYNSEIHYEYANVAIGKFIDGLRHHDYLKMMFGVEAFDFYSMIFKRKILEEEQEYRFIISRPKLMKESWHTWDKKVNGGNKIIGEVTADNLKSIVINHRISENKNIQWDNAISKIQFFLKENGFLNTRVRKTVLPY